MVPEVWPEDRWMAISVALFFLSSLAKSFLRPCVEARSVPSRLVEDTLGDSRHCREVQRGLVCEWGDKAPAYDGASCEL